MADASTHVDKKHKESHDADGNGSDTKHQTATKSTAPHDGQPRDQLTLYSMGFCPYAQRTRMALKAKGVTYNLVDIDLKNKPQYIFELNPAGEVPIIVYQNEVVFDSFVTCEYVDEKFPGPPLMPEDPYARARVRMLVNYFNGKVCSVFYKILRAGKEITEESAKFRSDMDKYWDFMEEELRRSGGDYFVANQLTSADIAVYPWIQRMCALKEFCDYDPNWDAHPHVKRWFENLERHPVGVDCAYPPGRLEFFYEGYRVGKPDYMMPTRGELPGNADGSSTRKRKL